MQQRGFTVIELIIVIVLFSATAIVGFLQFNDFKQTSRDSERRTAINAMYYNLEDVFFKSMSYYPETIDEKKLSSMDKSLFTDPEGNKLGTAQSDYRYEPTNCDAAKCKGYTLRADLEKEADFVKTNK